MGPRQEKTARSGGRGEGKSKETEEEVDNWTWIALTEGRCQLLREEKLKKRAMSE